MNTIIPFFLWHIVLQFTTDIGLAKLLHVHPFMRMLVTAELCEQRIKSKLDQTKGIIIIEGHEINFIRLINCPITHADMPIDLNKYCSSLFTILVSKHIDCFVKPNRQYGGNDHILKSNKRFMRLKHNCPIQIIGIGNDCIVNLKSIVDVTISLILNNVTVRSVRPIECNSFTMINCQIDQIKRMNIQAVKVRISRCTISSQLDIFTCLHGIMDTEVHFTDNHCTLSRPGHILSIKDSYAWSHSRSIVNNWFERLLRNDTASDFAIRIVSAHQFNISDNHCRNFDYLVRTQRTINLQFPEHILSGNEKDHGNDCNYKVSKSTFVHFNYVFFD